MTYPEAQYSTGKVPRKITLNRRLFSAMDKSLNEARLLETENERMQVEKRAQATPLRVEKLARERLQMRSATPAITHYVNAGTGSVLGSASATPPETVKL